MEMLYRVVKLVLNRRIHKSREDEENILIFQISYSLPAVFLQNRHIKFLTVIILNHRFLLSVIFVNSVFLKVYETTGSQFKLCSLLNLVVILSGGSSIRLSLIHI